MANPEPDPLQQSDVRDASVRTLGSEVSKLSKSIANLSTSTVKAAGSQVTAATNSLGMKAGTLAGVGIATSINPIAGAIVKNIVDKNQGAFVSAFRGMTTSTTGILKSVANLKAREVRSMSSANSSAQFEGRIQKRRLDDSSYNKMYGSDSHIEAIDRLRISNAEWLKAIGTLPKNQLKAKKLPKAAVGGVVNKTGQAIVHEGEIIAPANFVRRQTEAMVSLEKNQEKQMEALDKMSTGLNSGYD